MNGAMDSGGMPPRESGDHGADGTDPAADATERMRAAVKAIAGGTGTREDLQGAARALVGNLRQRREPPEQVLVQIKRILSEAGLQPGFPVVDGTGAAIESSTSIYRDVITWSIRSYYEDQLPGRSRGDGA